MQETPSRHRVYADNLPLSHTTYLTVRGVGVDYSGSNRLRLQRKVTHKFRGATLHERSEGDHTPEDAIGRIVRPVLTHQRLNPTPIMALLRKARLLTPREATCSVI